MQNAVIAKFELPKAKFLSKWNKIKKKIHSKGRGILHNLKKEAKFKANRESGQLDQSDDERESEEFEAESSENEENENDEYAQDDQIESNQNYECDLFKNIFKGIALKCFCFK